MADVRTVHKTTGDHTTVQAAVTWMVDTWDEAGIGTIRILDKAEYVENGISLGGMKGTPTLTSHVRLENDTAAWNKGIDPWPSGTFDSSSGGVRSGGSDHVFYCAEDYLHFDRFNVYQDDDASTSKEGITIRSAAENVLIEKCFVKSGGTQSDQDAVYMLQQSTAIELTIFDSVLRCETDGVENAGGRSCFNMQLTTGSANVTLHMYNCTLDSSSDDDYGGACIAQVNTGKAGLIWNVYNNIVVGDGDWAANGTAFYIRDIDGGGGFTVNGTHNCSVDASATAVLSATNTINSTHGFAGGEDIEFTSATNWQLVDGSGADDAIGYSSGTVPADTRIDKTVDIAGNVRNTTDASRDCGAYELIAASTAGPSAGSFSLLGVGI